MPAAQLTSEQLQARQAADPALVILDVRLADDFERCHIPGAVNNCVYEVAFLERLPALVPTKATPVCVYGASADSHEAGMAVQKLERAGYTQVSQLHGCLDAWCGQALPQEGTQEPLATPPVPHGRLPVDVRESRVEWVGRNLLNKHWGKVPLKSGWLQLDHGEVTGGELILNLHDITSDDLAGGMLHDVLIAHLRSDDFFDTERYPEARLAITKAVRIKNASPGAQNLAVEADLTLRGVTAPISFTAAAGVDDQGHCAAQAAFSIDRTRWGVLYGSGGFFKRLAGHLVNDMIELQVRVVTA